MNAYNPLRKALSGAGLVSRDAALARARENVEELRDDLTCGLRKEVAAIEALAAPGQPLPRSALEYGIVLAPVVCNLAGELGHGLLRDVATSLYDLLLIMRERDLACPEPVIVHAHAARLAAPGMPPVPPDAAAHLLAQLHAVVARFREG